MELAEIIRTASTCRYRQNTIHYIPGNESDNCIWNTCHSNSGVCWELIYCRLSRSLSWSWSWSLTGWIIINIDNFALQICFTKSLHFPKGLGNQWKILENGLILDKYVDQNMSLPHVANMSILDIFVQDFKAVQKISCSNILTV